MKNLKTIHAAVDPSNPDDAVIGQAAEIIRRGGLVAFPTETVYGLGADAQNPEAVSRVYQVKGRPSDNPLIWHGNSLTDFECIADFSTDRTCEPLSDAWATSGIASNVQKLAKAFWPGPLTMVLPLLSEAGLIPCQKTIAIRVPSHPIIRALIAASGCVIAAPSANLSGRPSPTTAKHVIEDLNGAIEMIIDGGPAQNGLESTVIDLSNGKVPQLLRPGAITLEMLQDVIGEVAFSEFKVSEDAAPLSPGMKYRHYAPKAPLILVIGSPEAVSAKAKAFTTEGKAVGLLTTSNDTLETVAQSLFGRLRQFDEMGVDVIVAEGVKEEGIGLAIMNRLKKAAAEVIYL